MSDLISRKEAIEKIYSLKRERINPLETDKAMNYILEVAASCLYYLPSAQPEITLESAIDYLHSIGWMQEHDRILTESAQQRQRWIPVSERLPEQDQICLICGKNGGVYVARFWRNETLILWTKTGTGKFAKAVAWMPLPEPYKGEIYD